MKILLASDSYTYTVSGVANVVMTLARELRLNGHEVKVLSLANRLTSFRAGDHDNDYYIRSVPLISDPVIRYSFARHDPLLDELIQWKPDLIHLHTEASVARLARLVRQATQAKLVMTAHTDYTYFAFHSLHTALPVVAFMRFLGKRVYRDADALFVPSEKARSFPQLASVADRIVVIPNGICLEKYRNPADPASRAALFRRYGLKDNGFTLVMTTRISREKNLMEILTYLPALLHELPEAQLIIVGDGPDRKRLEKYCHRHQLQDHVVFTGMVPADEVCRYDAMGDIFVSASVFEVHSLSNLEAMACGLPLVCRKDDSLLGVLDNGVNGRIYETEAEFVTAVTEILRNPVLKESMHQRALERVESFSDERFIENTMQAYEAVLMRCKA